MCAAGEDLESTKQRLGGRRTAIGYTKGTMFEARTSLPAKRHVGQRVLVHLFYNLREVDGGKFSINTLFVAVSFVGNQQNQYEGTRHPF